VGDPGLFAVSSQDRQCVYLSLYLTETSRHIVYLHYFTLDNSN